MWCFISFIIPHLLPEGKVENTEKWGLILRNEVWSGEINIVGDIWSLPGTTVKLKPGTKVVVSTQGDRFNLDWLPWDLRSGLNIGPDSYGVKNGELFWDEKQKIQMHFAKLYAVGTKEQPIIIQSSFPRPGSPYDINSISLERGILSYAKLSNYRRLEVGTEVIIENSELRDVVECAVCAQFTSPVISGNIFENALREYIFIQGGSPRINDNLFMDSKSEGVIVDPHFNGAPHIYHNSFEMPGKIALRFISGDADNDTVVSLNNFAGASIILLPCNNKVYLNQNQIKGVIKLENSGNCVGSMEIGPNYWLSSDTKAILREKIVNKEAGFEVLLPSILLSSPSGVGRRAR